MFALLTWLGWTLGIVVIGGVAYYGAVPLLVRRKLLLNGRPIIAPVKIGEMPPEAHDYFGQTAVGLQECGFAVRTYLHVGDAAPDTQAYVALWVNESAAQQAMASIIYHHPPGQAVRARRYVEFMTRSSEDATVVLTNNSAVLEPFPPIAPRHVLARVPTADIGQMYRVHLFREAQFLRPDVRRHLPDAGDEVQMMADGIEFDLRRQVKAGFLFEDEAVPNLFRPTLVGTYKMVWGEMAPFRDGRHSTAHQEAARAMREALQHPLRPPTNVPMTHKSPYALPPRRLPRLAA